MEDKTLREDIRPLVHTSVCGFLFLLLFCGWLVGLFVCVCVFVLSTRLRQVRTPRSSALVAGEQKDHVQP